MKQIINIIEFHQKTKNNKINYNKSNPNIYERRIIKNYFLVKTKNKNRIKSKYKYILFKILLLFILILSLIIIYAFYFRNKESDDGEDNYKPDNKTIFYEYQFDPYDVAFNKSKDFINNNLKGLLINTEKVKLSQKPKVSIVIPCYNCKKFLLRAIRSIQNQNFSNYEIIISNDGSTDDTLIFIEQLQKEENRIRIINNKKNMGLLHSRCIGSLAAKGKYIFPMDSDDMFLDKDVVFVLTNIISKGNFDIIIYNSISTDLKPDVYTTKVAKSWYDHSHIPNRVLFQPELGYYHISPSYSLDNIDLNDELIHGKFFRTKIYKKAVNRLGKERYSRFMILAEDDIVNNCIFNIAKSAKFIAKYGYIYVDNAESYSKKKADKLRDIRDFLYILDPLIDFTLDIPRNKKVLVNFIFFLFKDQYLEDLLNIEYDKKVFISCLERILECKYISKEDKNDIRTRGKMLNFIKYNFL